VGLVLKCMMCVWCLLCRPPLEVWDAVIQAIADAVSRGGVKTSTVATRLSVQTLSTITAALFTMGQDRAHAASW
jgi:hypothetical protein